MSSHNISVQERGLSAKFQKFGTNGCPNSAFPCTGQTCEPQTEPLFVLRWVALVENFRAFWPCEPLRQRVPFLQIRFSNLRSRNGLCFLSFLHKGFLFIPCFFWEINELLKWNHFHSNFPFVFLQILLSSIRVIKRLAKAI